MKLTLARFRDLSILIAAGPVSVDNFAVLRAGIKKLFREGKNKIILEVPDAERFPSEVLRDLAALNLLANEMAGQIVLARVEPLVRMKIEAFAKPPVARCFRTREEAVGFFHPGTKDELAATDLPSAPPAAAATSEPVPPAPAAPVPSAAPAPSTPASHLPPAGEAGPLPAAAHPAQGAPPPTGQTKDEIRNREIGDLNAARNRIVTLENENNSLRTQLEALVVKRREAPDLPAAQEKIELLQKQIDEMIVQLNAPPAKK